MEIKVKIEALGLQEAISALAEALTNLDVTQKPAVTIVQTDQAETGGQAQKEKKVTEEKMEEPKTETKKETPKITLETVRTKLAELNSAGKGAQVKALIAEFDPSDRPKLSNVSADDYAELLEKAAEI